MSENTIFTSITDKKSKSKSGNFIRIPQTAPGAYAAQGHVVENSIPLSIFPIATDKFCFVFCGLPGRGKTHIANRLKRYLDFFHAVPVEVYNAGEYRRKLFGAIHDAEFFDSDNMEAVEKRNACNEACITDMVNFLNVHNKGVVLYDAVNSTFNKRNDLLNKMYACGAKVTFIEVQNSNAQELETKYHEVAVTSPDYVGMGNNDAVADYKKRVSKYELLFETLGKNPDPIKADIEERCFSYLICDHSRNHFVSHNVSGYLPQKVISFIEIMRTDTHSFYLSRHGQSEYNAVGRIGGDSGLSPYGLEYAKRLADFVDERILVDDNGNALPGRLWTSTMVRTKQTAQYIRQKTLLLEDKMNPTLKYEWVQMRPRAWHHLDELFAGSCDGMTYEEIEEQFPEEFQRRKVDKLAYRYPRGESYLDVIARLEPIIIEMERHKEPLLIIGHQGILRIIYAFYMGKSRSEAPYVSIPLNTVVQLTPKAFDCTEERHLLYSPERALSPDGQDEKKFMVNPDSH